jgi:hypothetical protein
MSDLTHLDNLDVFVKVSVHPPRISFLSHLF